MITTRDIAARSCSASNLAVIKRANSSADESAWFDLKSGGLHCGIKPLTPAKTATLAPKNWLS